MNKNNNGKSYLPLKIMVENERPQKQPTRFA